MVMLRHLASFIDVLSNKKAISNVYVASFSEIEDFSGAITLNYSIVFSFSEFVEEEESEGIDEDNNEQEAE